MNGIHRISDMRSWCFVILTSTFFLFSSLAFGQGLSEEESKLYDLIMEYRESRGLEVVPLSPALNQVARMHVQDLIEHPPKGRCNLHSWSKYGEYYIRLCRITLLGKSTKGLTAAFVQL